jgi:hypothetical protein
MDETAGNHHHPEWVASVKVRHHPLLVHIAITVTIMIVLHQATLHNHIATVNSHMAMVNQEDRLLVMKGMLDVMWIHMAGIVIITTPVDTVNTTVMEGVGMISIVVVGISTVEGRKINVVQ